MIIINPLLSLPDQPAAAWAPLCVRQWRRLAADSRLHSHQAAEDVERRRHLVAGSGQARGMNVSRWTLFSDSSEDIITLIDDQSLSSQP